VNRTPLTPQIFDPMFLWDRRIEVEPPQGAPQDSRTSTMFIPRSWFGGRQAWLIGFNMLLNLDHLIRSQCGRHSSNVILNRRHRD
jgi:hypothetical protein